MAMSALMRNIFTKLLQLQMFMRMVEATFRLQTANNGSVLCAVDTPSHSLSVDNINAAMFSAQVPPVVLCAHQCTAFGNCLAFNHKVYATGQQTCDFYMFQPTNFTTQISGGTCSFYGVNSSDGFQHCNKNGDGMPKSNQTTAMSERTTNATVLSTTTLQAQAITTSVWCADMAAASVPRISAENCHYPFTYNGRLYHGCAENLDGVTSTCESHGCFALNYTKAVCAANFEFEVEDVSMNLTIPTEGSVPVVSIFGWIVFQHRDVVTGFSWDRNWLEYKSGFGDSAMDDFWLGLERVYLLTTSRNYRLRIEWQDRTTDMWFSIEYWLFYIDDEANGYMLHVDGYVEGDDGRAIVPGAVSDLLQRDPLGLGAAHDGTKFSTLDVDNDGWTEGSCATIWGGGYWFTNSALLTPTIGDPDWYSYGNNKWYYMKKSRMMIKMQ